jgi:hypothetical protein
LENGDLVPGLGLSTGRIERHWRDDEGTAIAALERLGFSRDDIVAEAMRSPKQVELRAKARGLKVPSEFIISTRSGTSLTRVENAHVPVPGRDEIVRFLGSSNHQKGEKLIVSTLNTASIATAITTNLKARTRQLPASKEACLPPQPAWHSKPVVQQLTQPPSLAAQLCCATPVQTGRERHVGNCGQSATS